jgi:flavin-dependent dehydrogenase
MVKRDEFDEILLNNAARSGAKIFNGHLVTDIVQEAGKVVGVMVRDNQGTIKKYHFEMVFDCSGFGAVIPKKC